MSDHLIAEANRHAKALPKMTSDTPQLLALMQKTRHMKAYDCVKEFEALARKLEKENATLREALVNAEELERYSGNGRRQWGRCSAWLNPDDAVVIISAKALDAARKEAQP